MKLSIKQETIAAICHLHQHPYSYVNENNLPTKHVVYESEGAAIQLMLSGDGVYLRIYLKVGDELELFVHAISNVNTRVWEFNGSGRFTKRNI